MHDSVIDSDCNSPGTDGGRDRERTENATLGHANDSSPGLLARIWLPGPATDDFSGKTQSPDMSACSRNREILDGVVLRAWKLVLRPCHFRRRNTTFPGRTRRFQCGNRMKEGPSYELGSSRYGPVTSGDVTRPSQVVRGGSNAVTG